MALKHRIEKLEKRGGRDVPPFIVFIKGQKTEAEAIAEWEAINGPLGSQKPEVCRINFVSRYGGR